ncbi:MAG: efflux RND transporter permease subunit [Firmicutes bacterium]|nr:efflux RND transporter permease subunit [Bacillota bacterium]MBQ9059516.1 efflux RND transporter permease subunit [Bacillota bacterium]
MLSKLSVRKPFTIFVAVVIVLIFGSVSLYKMTPDLFPSLNAPVAVVLTTDPGASAEEAEKEITEPLEQQLATLPNVDELQSVSADNFSYITLVFTDDVNMDAISVDIRDKVDQIKDQLPEAAGSPIVMKINLDMLPVAVAAVSMKDKDTAEVSTLTRDELMTPLEGTEGVASINAIGMIDDGLRIVLDQDKIDDLNERIRDSINQEINDGKGAVKSGINKAKKGENQIEDGKDKITKGQKKAVKKFTKAKKKLLRQKAKLQAQKETLQAQKEALISLAQSIAEDFASMDPVRIQAAMAKLQAAGFESVEDLQTAIDQMDLTQFDSAISQIEQGLADIEGQEAAMDFSLSTGYSDLSSAESTVQMTISQLEQTLQEIEDSRDAALAGADLDQIITMDNVAAILTAQNFSMPAGYVTDGDDEILVSVGDKIADQAEMENLILFDMGMDDIEPIRVRDIGHVEPASVDQETYARINGENGVLLSFTKQSTYATATVADNIAKKFESLEKKHDGLHFTTLMDQGEYIHTVINSVLKNLLLGAILAIAILLFFLRDIRPTIITAISIPVSVIFAIALMYFSGVTLNMISLSGLAIGVGMLVDNSIVVIENIYRLRGMGYSLVQSALSGAVQVAGAITASTLTTICVFVPIIFVDGTTKDIFMDLALTVTYSLLASLLIALTLAPAMAKGLLKKTPKKTVLGQKGRVVAGYKTVCAWALKHKAIVLIGSLVLLLGSAGGLLSRGFEFMPSMSTPQISATITMPEDSTIEETAAINDEIMDKVRKIDGVETAGAMLASNTLGSMGISGADQDVTETTMYIVLDESKTKNAEKIVKLMKKFEKRYNLTIQTSADVDMTSYMGGSDIGLTLFSDDLDALRTSAEDIERRLGEMKQLEDVSDITDNRTEEIHITVDKNLAMDEGLTVAQVYQQIAGKLQKEKSATTLKQAGTSIEVNVENATSQFSREELEDLELTVDQKDGTKDTVKLIRIADISEDASLNQIQHEGQRRSIAVSAAVKDGYNITKMTSQVRRTIEDENLLQKGVTIEYGGQNEEIMHSMRQMLLMLLVGFALVYLIMVAQFQSMRSPFIIIFAVPLAFTGGMLSLLLTGQVLSVVGMFGFVMLMGIVVNNAIVLVDTVNRFRLEGMGMEEAIIHAGSVRMRPVLMTAATTILGLIPLALGIGNGAEMVQPVAVVCIGGLLFGTVMTLLIIPVMYRLIGRKHMEKIAEEELEIITA